MFLEEWLPLSVRYPKFHMYQRNDIMYPDTYNGYWFYSTQNQDLIGPWFCFGESSFTRLSVPACKVKLTSCLALGMYLWPNPNSDSTFYASQFGLVTVWFKNRHWIQVCRIKICEIQFWGFSLIFLRQGKETSLFVIRLGASKIYVLELLLG